MSQPLNPLTTFNVEPVAVVETVNGTTTINSRKLPVRSSSIPISPSLIDYNHQNGLVSPKDIFRKR